MKPLSVQIAAPTDLPLAAARAGSGAPIDLVGLAFRALFDAEFRYVWNTLRYLGVRPADVQDIGQDVFLTVHRLLSAGEVPQKTRSWLFALCHNAASNYRQLARHRREVTTDEAPDAPDSSSNIEARLASHEQWAQVTGVLDALDFDRRAVLVSHDMDEIPMPEIAEALGVPLNTAYSRLRLARRDFQAAARRSGLDRGDA